jgi:HAE1 family hydrophobic/amphiphilic exporter-1
MGDRLDAVRAEAAKLDLPPGYTTGVSGRGRELERTFVEFIWASCCRSRSCT